MVRVSLRMSSRRSTRLSAVVQAGASAASRVPPWRGERTGGECPKTLKRPNSARGLARTSALSGIPRHRVEGGGPRMNVWDYPWW